VRCRRHIDFVVCRECVDATRLFIKEDGRGNEKEFYIVGLAEIQNIVLGSLTERNPILILLRHPVIIVVLHKWPEVTRAIQEIFSLSCVTDDIWDRASLKYTDIITRGCGGAVAESNEALLSYKRRSTFTFKHIEMR
jgi:hypothetical protein